MHVPSITTAIDNINQLARTYEGLVQVSKLLTEVSSLEGHVKELAEKRDHLIKENIRSEQDLAHSAEAADAQSKRAAEKLADTLARGKELELEAEQKVSAMIATAKDEAHAEGEKILEVAHAEAKRLSEEYAAAAEAIAEVKVDLEQLLALKAQYQEDAGKAKGVLDSVLEKIDSIKRGVTE